jgi:hypothetical protein
VKWWPFGVAQAVDDGTVLFEVMHAVQAVAALEAATSSRDVVDDLDTPAHAGSRIVIGGAEG